MRDLPLEQLMRKLSGSGILIPIGASRSRFGCLQLRVAISSL